MKSIPEITSYDIVTNTKTQWLGMSAVKFMANAASNTGKSYIVEGIFAYDEDNNAIYSVSLTHPATVFEGDFDKILNNAKLS